MSRSCFSSGSFNLSFSIAGLPTRLICGGLDAAAAQRLRQHYAAFALPTPPSGDRPVPSAMPAPSGEPTTSPGALAAPNAPARAGWMEIHVAVVPGEVFLPLDPPRWRVRTWQDGGRVHFQSHAEAGWFDLAAGYGELTLRPTGNPENYLRALYAWRCLEAGALLVHAGGVLRHGRGWVFFGPSGSGKTTAVSLSPQAHILSDDLVILRCESLGQGLRVDGVPFRGDLPEAPRSRASAPLAGLFALRQSTAHALTPLPPAEAVARLAACIPFVMGSPQPAARVLALCAEFVRRAPVQTLHFRRDAAFWSVIDESFA